MNRVCDLAHGICVDCVRDADCMAGQSCVASTCRAALVDAGADSGIDAARTTSDATMADDTNDAHVPVDAATTMDTGGCADDGASAVCATATPIGTGSVDAGGTITGTVGSLPDLAASAWYTVQFPPAANGAPHVDFAMNDGGSYVLDVFISCSGTASTCGGGEMAMGLTTWDFGDGCVPVACQTTRNIVWPAQIWIRVRRVATSATCAHYQLRVSELVNAACSASTTNHCGPTCEDCTIDIARATGAFCSAGGTCDYASCASGASDCDGVRSNGCEAWTTSACGPACSNCDSGALHVSGASSCNGGACNFTACATGFANCDGSLANGCERSTPASATDCCGVACTTPATCQGSALAGYACH